MDSSSENPVMYPLSKSQREQFVLAGEADAGANVNLGGMMFWFDGECVDAAVERAVNLIVEREQSLRLRIARCGGDILQYETEFEPFAIPVERTTLSREEVVEREKRLMNAFSFAYDGPLCDFRIIRADSAVALRTCFHHVIMDGRSLMIFGVRLYEYVALLRSGRPVPGEPHRFTDSIEAEAALLESERCRANRLYWLETTRDWRALCVMNPAAEGPAAANGRQLTRELEREYGQKINGHCERFGITPAHLFQTALAIHLFRKNPGIRYADMGQTVAARRSIGEKMSLGNYALELFLRVPLDERDRLEEVQRSVREANFESLARSLCTYEDVVAMKRGALPGVVAMRDLMFTYIPPAEPAAVTLDVDWLVNESPETSVEFLVFHLEDKNSFTVIFDYREGVYSPAGAENAFRSIMSLVDMCLTDVSMTVKEAVEKCATI